MEIRKIREDRDSYMVVKPLKPCEEGTYWDIGDGFERLGKRYTLAKLANLIAGNRNFCLDHDKNVAECLRKHWKDEEKKKKCYNGLTTKKLRDSI